MTVPVSNKPFAVVLLCATLCSAGDRSIDRARVARRHGHAGRHPADLDRPRPDRQRLHLPLNQGDHGTRPHRPALGRSGRTRSGPRSPLGPVYGSRSCPTPPAVNDGVRVGVDGGAAQGRTAVSIPRVSMSGGLKSERLSSRSVFQRDHRIAASATTAVRGQVGADGPRSESGSAGALVPRAIAWGGAMCASTEAASRVGRPAWSDGPERSLDPRRNRQGRDRPCEVGAARYQRVKASRDKITEALRGKVTTNHRGATAATGAGPGGRTHVRAR